MLKLQNAQSTGEVFLSINIHKETDTHTHIPSTLRQTTATDFPRRFTIGHPNSCLSPDSITQEQGARTRHKFMPIKEPKINLNNQAFSGFFSSCYFLLIDWLPSTTSLTANYSTDYFPVREGELIWSFKNNAMWKINHESSLGGSGWKIKALG